MLAGFQERRTVTWRGHHRILEWTNVVREREIFLTASEIEDPDQLVKFLDKACEGDDELRQRLNVLLAASSGRLEITRFLLDAIIPNHEYPLNILTILIDFIQRYPHHQNNPVQLQALQLLLSDPRFRPLRGGCRVGRNAVGRRR